MRNSLSLPELVAGGTESKLVELGIVYAVPQPSEAMSACVAVVELQKTESDCDRAVEDVAGG